MRQMYIQNTKKSLVAILLILLVLLSAGCGKIDDSSETEDISLSEADSAASEFDVRPAGIGKTISEFDAQSTGVDTQPDGIGTADDIQTAKDDYVVNYILLHRSNSL